MFPSKARFPLKKEFHRLKKTSQMFQGKFFGLLLSPQETPLPHSRFAIIVSNKVSKKAVVRNKLRRYLSEVLKDYWFQIRKGFDGVFLLKKTAVGVSFQSFQKEVQLLLKKAKLFN
ncbi:ribonuclease P protein component [Candidatus Shapirobacteria bacterium]|nr:ribonuclease P protein component [Candidatus Shapirobacteria bacterium]